MLFSTDTFKCQLAARTVRLYMNRRIGIGIKLHPNKKKLREIMWQYAHCKMLGYSYMYMLGYLTEWLDIYFDFDYDYNMNNKLQNIIIQEILAQTSQNNCPICLDSLTPVIMSCDPDIGDIDSKCNRIHIKTSSSNPRYNNDLIICKGSGSHIYHIDCYMKFLQSEEQKDKDKDYKCESDTLCIACYQPMYV